MIDLKLFRRSAPSAGAVLSYPLIASPVNPCKLILAPLLRVLVAHQNAIENAQVLFMVLDLSTGLATAPGRFVPVAGVLASNILADQMHTEDAKTRLAR